MTAETLLCHARKALDALQEHLAETHGTAFAAGFNATYREALAAVAGCAPAAAPVPVQLAWIAASLEGVAIALELPNDADGTAEDCLLMTM